MRPVIMRNFRNNEVTKTNKAQTRLQHKEAQINEGLSMRHKPMRHKPMRQQANGHKPMRLEANGRHKPMRHKY
jgi:hypothetical protein